MIRHQKMKYYEVYIIEQLLIIKIYNPKKHYINSIDNILQHYLNILRFSIYYLSIYQYILIVVEIYKYAVIYCSIYEE